MLEAWAECEPQGFVLPERRAVALLFTLGAHLPGGNEKGLGGRAHKLEALVPLLSGAAAGDLPKGAIVLPARDGIVHFLQFWRCLDEVARMVAGKPKPREDAGATTESGVTTQTCVAGVERLRDDVLDLLAATGAEALAFSDLIKVIQNIRQVSVVPQFWKEVEDALGATASAETTLQVEELTVLLLSWLHEAVMWQHSPVTDLKAGMLPVNMRTGLLMPPDDLNTTMLPGSAQSTLSRPGSQLCVHRPSRSLMASNALVLDLEEHWRAAGVMSVDEDSFRLIDSTLGTPRLEPVAESPPNMLSPGRSSAAAPTSVADEQTGDPLPPGEAPIALQVMNNRTAMMPLDRTPRPGDLTGQLRDDLLPMPGEEDEIGIPVFLHVYDVSQAALIQRLNSVLAHRRSPLKFGGVFHAGVEVADKEWCFGATLSQTATGVMYVDPREDPSHHFRQTVPLKKTQLAEDEIDDIISRLKQEYLGRDYDLLRRNCCHFADDFCQRLGVGRIPGWVYRLARLGARIDNVVQPLRRPSSRESLRSREDLGASHDTARLLA